MTSTSLPEQGLLFWPVGTGDSTTIVIDDEHVVQVDLHDMVMADDDEAVVAAVVDRLIDVLPARVRGRAAWAVLGGEPVERQTEEPRSKSGFHWKVEWSWAAHGRTCVPSLK